MSAAHYKETKAHTPPPVFSVDYAGHISIQIGPYYGDKDILDASAVGDDVAEANGEFIINAYNHHQELVTRLYNLTNQVDLLLNGGIVDGRVKISLGALQHNCKEAKETLNKVTP